MFVVDFYGYANWQLKDFNSRLSSYLPRGVLQLRDLHFVHQASYPITTIITCESASHLYGSNSMESLWLYLPGGSVPSPFTFVTRGVYGFEKRKVISVT